MKNLKNCMCNCVTGDYHGIQKTDGKHLYCDMHGKGDCKGNPYPGIIKRLTNKLKLLWKKQSNT